MRVSFALPRGDGPTPLFDLPWPTELLRRESGRPDFRAFPAADTLAFGAYVAAAGEDVDGYSVAPSIYFHFTGPLDDARLPTDPRAFASASSPVMLVDVDPDSPERGTLRPLVHRVYRSGMRFVPSNTLAVKPTAGDILRPGTLYAAVVRRDLIAAGLGTTMDLEAIKWTAARADAREERARKLHAPAFDRLASLGVPREQVAAIALFRTQVPEAVTARMLEVATHQPPSRSPRIVEASWATHLAMGASPAPRPGPLATGSGRATYLAIDGVYCTPNFQSQIRRAPFLAEEGGRVVVDAAGVPQLADVPIGGRYGSRACGGLLRARFVLTIPTTAMPKGGFPLLVVAHGTGGDAESFVGPDDFAGWAARQGIAVVSTDQPLHGGRGFAPRPGSREPISVSIGGIPLPIFSGAHAAEAAFYNPLHPDALRDNLRQAAIDAMVLARLVTATDFASARGADGELLLAPRPTVTPPRFDAERVLAAGHSQGCHSVAVMGAIDPLVRGVILSGCGGDARLGVLARRDVPIVPVFATLLGLAPDELDELHPLMALVQTLADPVDPASYARRYWDPKTGGRAPSVLHFEGMTDTFAPPVTAELLAIALHMTALPPVLKALPSVDPTKRPFAELLAEPGPTRAFVQLASTRHENGHFVLFREPRAAQLAMEFMRAMAR